LVFIFSCTNCYFSKPFPSRHPSPSILFAVFSLAGTFFFVFYSGLPVLFGFFSSLCPPHSPNSTPALALWLLLTSFPILPSQSFSSEYSKHRLC
jgi:hypothetical protein